MVVGSAAGARFLNYPTADQQTSASTLGAHNFAVVRRLL